jgi:3-oxoacyl-[acyl-carrier protein] reductase
MDLGLRGRAAFVTGAGGAIGSAIARQLAAEGAAVAVADIDERAARSVADTLAASGARAVAVCCDVTDAASVREAHRAAVGGIGRTDILVNNAGFNRDANITDMADADWDAVMDVCLRGTFNCTRAMLPGMAENRWGRVVSIASRAALGNPGQTNYSAAKAGVIGFTRALSLEQARFGITANVVSPGLIDTPQLRASPSVDKLLETARRNPVGFIGRPEHIAAPVVFLCSELAAYITGATLIVSGGHFAPSI